MEKGLGFKKNKNDPIDQSLIERLYVIEKKGQRSHLEKSIANIPFEIIQTTNHIIKYASEQLDKDLSDATWLGLVDHIQYAIERAKNNIPVTNALLFEISRFYRKEFLMAKEAMILIEQEHHVTLPEDEAGFIALHFVNAQMKEQVNMQETMQTPKIIQKILDIVKYHYRIELNEETIHFERFVTHLRYFVLRLMQGRKIEEDDSGFIEIIKDKFKEEYKCAKRIETYVVTELGYTLTEDEMIYLAVHIRRVVDEKREI